MSSIKLKIFYLLSYPINGKISSDIKVKDIKRIEINATSEASAIYSNTLKAIRDAFNLDYDEKLNAYLKDDDNDLISITTDKELLDEIKSAEQVNKLLNIYFTTNNYNNEQIQTDWPNDDAENGSSETVLRYSATNIPDSQLINLGVLCDGCSDRIFGYRYNCTKCKDYDLCKSCYEKGMHKEHSFDKLRPDENIFDGWSCDMCKTEDIKDVVYGCKGCTKEYSENGSLFILCSDCEKTSSKHSSRHTLAPFHAKLILNERHKQILALEKLISKGKHLHNYPGIECSWCKKDGVSFECTTFMCYDNFLCEQCFLKGKMAGFSFEEMKDNKSYKIY